MSLDSQLITLAVDDLENFRTMRQLGVIAEDFEEPFNRIWTYLIRTYKSSGSLPSREIVARRFSDAVWARRTRKTDLPILYHELRERRAYNHFIDVIQTSVRNCEHPENLKDVLPVLQGELNSLSMRNGQNPLVDVTNPQFRKYLFSEIRMRRSEQMYGVSTGFPTLDAVTGGLQAGRLISVIARAGSYKTWFDLCFVAEGVMQGKKVVLYPLEMTLFETMMRLYTIFSHKIFGGRKTFKNLDLTQGRVNKARFIKFLSMLEDQYNGQLLVADVGKLDGDYTVERIEAEIEVHQPHMFWVDYLTLMRIPNLGRDSKESSGIRLLTRGLKNITQRLHVIGGVSAQVNREWIKTRSKVPRLDHISLGDSLGGDADQVVSLAKQNSTTVLYGLVKNRHGPEIPTKVCRVDVNNGVLTEVENDDEEDDD